jgi:uncharacterized membrane protein YgdD (TMEM256/DUF423 family)
MRKYTLIMGGILGLTGIALGAMGAHALKEILSPEKLESFVTGTRYQMYHALFLLVVGLLMQKSESKLLKASAHLAVVGTLLFSGSVYLLATAGWKFLGPVTPLGGITLMSAWALLILHFIREKTS